MYFLNKKFWMIIIIFFIFFESIKGRRYKYVRNKTIIRPNIIVTEQKMMGKENPYFSESEYFTLVSPQFNDKEELPFEFSFYGNNTNPQLEWYGKNVNAKSFALLMEGKIHKAFFVHWIIWNIPPNCFKVFPNISKTQNVKEGEFEGIQGYNDYGTIGYRGPSSELNITKYYFKIYALNSMLDIEKTIKGIDIKKELKKYIVDYAEIRFIFSYNESNLIHFSANSEDKLIAKKNKIIKDTDDSAYEED